MSEHRSYPDEAAGPFPSPPSSFVDDAGREIEIDRIAPDDQSSIDRLVEMYRTFDPADRAQGIPPVREQQIRDWLELVLGDGPDIVSSHDGRVVGHATLVPDGEGGYELAIFVHQDYQGNGVGSRLLRSLLGAAAADGIDRVWLTVERWNTVAVSLYESVGFRAADRGRFELEMSLRLAQD